MTAWIIVAVLTAAFAVAVRRGSPDAPMPPAGYERERQLAELRALADAPPVRLP